MKKIFIGILSLLLTTFLVFNNTIVKADDSYDKYQYTVCENFMYSDYFMYNNIVYDITQIPDYVMGGNLKQNGNIVYVNGDDPLVTLKIIPKEYFVNIGSHAVFGEEYGYCIYTEPLQDCVLSTKSSVMLFDIEKNWVSGEYTHIISINIVGQFEYYTIQEEDVSKNLYDEEYWLFRNESLFIGYDFNFPYVCPIPLESGGYKVSNKISISKVGMANYIENCYTLNSFDEGYNQIRDNGMFIQGINYSYKGNIINEIEYSTYNLEETLKDIVTFSGEEIANLTAEALLNCIFEFVPYKKVIQGVFDVGVGTIDIASKAYVSEELVVSKTVNPDLYEHYGANVKEQLNKNGMLKRSVVRVFGSDTINEGSELLINQGDYISFYTYFAYESNHIDENEEYNIKFRYTQDFTMNDYLAMSFGVIKGDSYEFIDGFYHMTKNNVGYSYYANSQADNNFDYQEKYIGISQKPVKVYEDEEVSVEFESNFSEVFSFYSSNETLYYLPSSMIGYNVSIKNSNFDQIYYFDSYNLNNIFKLNKDQWYYFEIWKDLEDDVDPYAVDKQLKINICEDGEYIKFVPVKTGKYCLSKNFYGYYLCIFDFDSNEFFVLKDYVKSKYIYLEAGKEYYFIIWKNDDDYDRLIATYDVIKYSPTC